MPENTKFQGTTRKIIKYKISKLEAKKKGLETYFTGKPCLRRHVAERYISNRRCVTCVFLFYKKDQKKYRKKKKGKKTQAEWWQKYRKTEIGKKNSNKAQVKYNTKRLKEDPKFKLMFNLRSRFKSYLNQTNSKKISSITKLIGCSPLELKKHFEKNFRKNMTWKNHGAVWHIDHIFPMAAFDIEDINDLKICFNYRNLQPLDKIENWKKSDNYSKNELSKFKKNKNTFVSVSKLDRNCTNFNFLVARGGFEPPTPGL